jgi:tyrosyl-tRNA synthetase
MNLKSGFLQEFFERGYLAQCTDISSLDDIFLQQKITAYIGFDCTAKSLHVGSLIQIMILRLLQKHNHKTIILLGGGTTKIGDPSGKDDARQILDSNKINENLTGIHKTLQKFINFQENKAILINNDNWLKDLNYVEFLRKVGKHFSVNKMLNFDSVKLRLEREQPLSFLEFNYMILQAFDFYELHKNHDCILQIGGSDQWGNIVNGVELIRKLGFENGLSAKKSEAFGLTSPLLTTFDGKKMGKTAEGAVWLDEAMLSPFDYFQYFRNTHDNDVIKFLKLFTDLSLEEIKKFENLNGQEINKAKEVLAFEATKICHGEEIANQILLKARGIFLQKNSENFEEKIITIEENNSKKLVEIIFEIKATESKADAKRLIEGNAVKINNQIINDINFSITTKNAFELSIGKKKFFKIIVK